MRPTIALCLIVKNEAHNLGPLLQSVKGCFDEIHITDTGSTDNTLDFINKINDGVKNFNPEWDGIPEIKVHHFEWVHDFSAARNFSFSHAKTDFVMWLDADDELSDAKKFIEWRDTVMHAAHMWTVIYNYAFDQNGNVECQFIRERVVKNNHGFEWKYFVHEGILQNKGLSFWPNKVNSWWVNHRRTSEDRKADHHRNLRLFEKQDYDSLEPRMKYYLGKEYVENGMPEKGSKPLLEALGDPGLEMHDRVMAFQYAAQSALLCDALAQVVELCFNCLKLVPGRAEAWCILGDAYVKMGRVELAKQAYKYALTCKPNAMGGIVVTFAPAYFDYPHFKLAEIGCATGDMDLALKSIEELKKVNHPDAQKLEKHYWDMKDLGEIRPNLPKVEDIVITCPPYSMVTDWDENTHKEKGSGGSETAAIEVARHLTKKTGRPVKIFQPRMKREKMDSGVEYLPVSELAGYFKNVEPYVHIAWRHSTKLTSGKNYVWCHDLLCQGAEQLDYDKIFALSEFHKNYLHQCQQIPMEKIGLLFNGINPDDFKEECERNPYKVVFSSSPDRGLDRAIRIVEKAREISGLDLELHSFYGFENMKKGGLKDFAEKIEKMIEERPWVKHHGFVNKKELMKHFKESAVWVYPANFIETYCITAIEALCAGAFPIVRDMGALKYTMKEAIEKGMCEVISTDCENESEVGIWAHRVLDAIYDKKWQKVSIDPEDYSWERVADKMIEEFNL